MHAVKTLCRRLAGALVALTLVMLATAPSLDALICGEDAAVAAATGDQTARADDAQAGHLDAAAHQPCAHGHCHHSLEFAPQALTRSPVIQASVVQRAWPAVLRPATLPPSGLDRPPRA